jgi:hypothetical protein
MPRPVLIDRQEFLEERFDPKDGDHLTVLGPTGVGKTVLTFQLLEKAIKPRKRPAVGLVMKPKDPEVKRWMDRLGLRTVRDWPPPPTFLRPAPTGWCLWPRHTFDPDVDDPAHALIFRRALIDSFKRGNRIIFADEVAGLVEELGLSRNLRAIWKRGRTMGAGLWSASQRPAFIPRDAYSMAEHLFIADDPDEQTRKRYGEIGGVDPKMIRNELAALPPYHFLYFRRTGRRICVVGP